MSNNIYVTEVKTPADVRAFVRFPLELYRSCPYFVPPLYRDEIKLVSTGGDTKSSDSVFFLATRDGKTVGRIQGIIQHQYNKIHNASQLRFTRFDSINDAEVSGALFRAVEKWGAERGMTEMCGPLGYSDLDREGLLVEGFEELSTFEEQYNYEYYGALCEAAGLFKDVDWLEYELTMPQKRNEMLSRVAARTLELNGLHIADTSLPKRKYIEKYRDGFFDCLDVCYRRLYGTVPLTRTEQDELIDQFMLIVNKEYAVFICDKDENVVAFGLCFPGIGKAVQKSGGRLTPATLLRLISTVKHPETIDLGLVAVRPEYQNSGINAVILDRLLDVLEKGEVKRCETNLNLEDNAPVQAQWKYFSARRHKRRRAYTKKISD